MTELERMGEQAVKAKYALAGLTEEKKNEALFWKPEGKGGCPPACWTALP